LCRKSTIILRARRTEHASHRYRIYENLHDAQTAKGEFYVASLSHEISLVARIKRGRASSFHRRRRQMNPNRDVAMDLCLQWSKTSHAFSPRHKHESTTAIGEGKYPLPRNYLIGCMKISQMTLVVAWGPDPGHPGHGYAPNTVPKNLRDLSLGTKDD